MQSVPSPFCKIQYVLYFIKIQGYHFPCGMMVIKAYLHFSVFTFYILGQFDGAYRRPMDAIFISVMPMIEEGKAWQGLADSCSPRHKCTQHTTGLAGKHKVFPRPIA